MDAMLTPEQREAANRRNREYRARHAERLREYFKQRARERYAKYPEKMRKLSREYRAANLEASRARALKWKKDNPERHAELNRKSEMATCPGCAGQMWGASRRTITCTTCKLFVRWLAGGKPFPSRETITGALGAYTKEQVEKWQAIKTRGQVMQSTKRSSRTLASQTSEEKPAHSPSSRGD